MQFAENAQSPGTPDEDGATQSPSSELEAEKRVAAAMLPSWLLTASTTSVWYLEVELNARRPWNLAILTLGCALLIGVFALVQRRRRNRADRAAKKPQPKLVYVIHLGKRFVDREGWRPMPFSSALIYILLIVGATVAIATAYGR